MKSLLLLCIVALLANGCTDSFTGPSTPPLQPAAPDKVLYTRLEDAFAYSGMPAGSIIERELTSNFEKLLIPGPAYLLCAPQNGRMLYAKYEYEQSMQMMVWVVRLADADGKNPEQVAVSTGLSSLLIQDAALSHDGRTVAYIVTQMIDSYKIMETLYLYRAGAGTTQPVDSVKYSTTVDSYGVTATSFMSQVAFSPFDRYVALASWGQGRAVRVYDVASGTKKLTTGTNAGPFVAWSPDEKQLVYSQNVGSYYTEPIPNMSSPYSMITYKVGYPSSSSIAVIDMNGLGQPLVYGLPPVLEIAWSHDGTRIAFSQLRDQSALAAGTDIVCFRINKPTELDKLTADTSLPTAKIRLQWSGDDKKLLFTECSYGYQLPYSLASSQIGYINVQSRGSDVLSRAAFGAYWLNSSATSVPKPRWPRSSDLLNLSGADK